VELVIADIGFSRRPSLLTVSGQYRGPNYKEDMAPRTTASAILRREGSANMGCSANIIGRSGGSMMSKALSSLPGRRSLTAQTSPRSVADYLVPIAGLHQANLRAAAGAAAISSNDDGRRVRSNFHDRRPCFRDEAGRAVARRASSTSSI